MKTNRKAVPTERTHEGAPAISVSPIKQLRRGLMASMLFEDGFYENGQDHAARISELVKKCSFADVAQAAIDAREKFKLRHAPLLIVREAIRHFSGRQVGDLVARVVQRPDELGELLSLYWKENSQAPLARQLKVGLARALKKFNEYQLAKWNQDAAVKLRDVLFLTHAKPRDEAQAALFKRLAEDTLASPETWENQLSAGGDKKAVFTQLLEEKKLGALALLRNLRGMLEVGVDERVIRRGIATMKTERVLPFRFLSAARYAPRLEDALESAMLDSASKLEKLSGNTALLIDHSQSMNNLVSAKSEISRYDAAAALAMILRETADHCRIFTFSDRCIEIPPRRGFGMRAALDAVRNPVNTMLGAAVRHVYKVYPECNRVIVITDEQSMDRPPHPRGRGYVVNVATNQNGIAYGPWVSIDGWSEACLDYIREWESEEAEQHEPGDGQ